MAMFQPVLQSQVQGQQYVAPAQQSNAVEVAGLNALGKGLELGATAYRQYEDTTFMKGLIGEKVDPLIVEKGDYTGNAKADLEANNLLNLTQIEAARQQGVPVSQLNLLLTAKAKEAIAARPDLSTNIKQAISGYFGVSGGSGGSGGGFFKEPEDEAFKFLQSQYKNAVESGEEPFFDERVFSSKEELSKFMAQKGINRVKQAEIDAKKVKTQEDFFFSINNVVNKTTSVVSNFLQELKAGARDVTTTKMSIEAFIDSQRATIMSQYGSAFDMKDRGKMLDELNNAFNQYQGEELNKLLTMQGNVDYLKNQHFLKATAFASDMVKGNPALMAFLKTDGTFDAGMLPEASRTALAGDVLALTTLAEKSAIKNIQADTPKSELIARKSIDFLASQLTDPKLSTEAKFNIFSKLDVIDSNLNIDHIDPTLAENLKESLSKIDSNFTKGLSPEFILGANDGKMPKGLFVLKNVGGQPLVVFEGEANNRDIMAKVAKSLTASVRLNKIVNGEYANNSKFKIDTINSVLAGGTPPSVDVGMVVGNIATDIKKAAQTPTNERALPKPSEVASDFGKYLSDLLDKTDEKGKEYVRKEIERVLGR